MRHRHWLTPALALGIAVLSARPAHAIEFTLESLGIDGVLNNNITLGGAMRLEKPSEDLIGKANLNPSVCAGVYQSCQGLFKDQVYPSRQLANAPGAPSMHNDNGDLNYNKGDMTQGGIRLTQDLTLKKGDFGFFARLYSFYDAINDRKKDYYPTLITAENTNQVGYTGQTLSPTNLNPNPSNRYFTRTYGPGQMNYLLPRTDSTLRRQLIADIQLMDFNLFGKVNIPLLDKELTFKIGRQNVNWGESTTLVINSINQAQAVNTNNLYRWGFQLEEIFTPINQLFLSFVPVEGHTIETFYQFEWRPVEIPAPGSFMSFVDTGTQNLMNYVNLSFGGSADDKDKTGFFLDNPLSLVTPTTAHINRLPDRTPSGLGQYGFALKNYFADLNGGTDISFYYMNYHSKLPYLSFVTGQASCARAEGNARGNNAQNTLDLLQDCPRLPVSVVPSANAAFVQDITTTYPTTNPTGAATIANDLGGNLLAAAGLLARPDGNTANLDSLVQLDSGPFFLDYPKNIHLFGTSFNTTAGDYSFQGEVAYRPNLPVQVSVIDVAFAAAQPFLTRCHDPTLKCAGSQAGGTGFAADGTHIAYGGSDAVSGCTGAAGNCDTINLILGAAPSSARAFPSFLVPYRGGKIGEGTPGTYIPGFERLQVLEYNLGITRVFGATDNVFGADQIISVLEFGATQVLNMPSLDQLQFDAPGVYYHASAGADGSGADGSRQACSTNPNCVVGADGMRFNPHQANLHNFATPFSWGYRFINIVKYESVFPGISFQPFIIWSHDVDGISPGPAGNFVRGRESLNFNFEARYKSALSGTIGYNKFMGGHEQNLYHDRDNLQFYLRYLF